MPVVPPVNYPGVYIQEVESGVHTIMAVDTATTALIGRALRGPVNQPVVIHSFGDFQRIFGGLWLQSKLGYAVDQFFLNGGSKAVIVRLCSKEAKCAEITVPQVQARARLRLFAIYPDAAFLEDGRMLPGELRLRAKNAGIGGNDLRVRVTYYKKADLDELKGKYPLKDAGENDLFRLEVYPGDPNEVQVYEALTVKKGEDRRIDTVLSKESKWIEVDGAVDESARPRKDQDLAAGKQNWWEDPAACTQVDENFKVSDRPGRLTFKASNEGVWGNNLRLRVVNPHQSIAAKLASKYEVEAEELFNLTVYDKATGLIEQFDNLTVKEGHRRQVDKVLANESSLVLMDSALPAVRPDIHEKQDDIAKIWVDEKGLYCSLALGDKGADSGPLSVDDYKAGVNALDKLQGGDLFNLLYIPPAGDDEDVDPSVLAHAAKYCEDHRAMLLVDPPKEWKSKDKAAARDPIGNLASPNAAVYFPRIKVRNSLHDNQMEEFGPGAAIAGIFARTDATRGVWKAPAGLEATLKGVERLSVSLTDMENGDLNPLGINCLRKMPAAGFVVWGARTMEGDDRLASQWKYIPVRRTALYIEESLYRGTQWAVFEPNDEPLWSQLRLNIGVFMHDLFRQGAFQGQTPKDAYFVKCDKTTTMQSDIDKGIVNIIVGFAPLKPAEFVILYIQQIAGQLAA